MEWPPQPGRDPVNRARGPIIRPERIIRLASAFSVLVWLAIACAGAPKGPPFVSAAPPPDHRARLYVYRADPRASLATVRITIDGRELGRFRNNEYETTELSAGTHILRAGMRGFGLFTWGWNSHRFLVLQGETAFLEISIRLAETTVPNSRNLEIAGRANTAVANENVFIVSKSAQQALANLETMTRLSRSDTGAN